MNSNNENNSLSGIQAAGSDVKDTSIRPSEKEDRMKRAIAKQMIERYYCQLTDGCGTKDCQNNSCASCPTFRYRDTDRNQLAVRAIELFQTKAHLCEHQPKKFCYPIQESQETMVLSPSEPSTSSLGASGGDKSSSTSLNKKTGKNMECLTEEKMKEIITTCQEEGSWSKLIRVIGSVFSNPDLLRCSFIKDSMEDSSDVPDTDVKHPVQETHSEPRTAEEELKLLTLDIESFRRMCIHLMNIKDHPFQGPLNNALLSLSKQLEWYLKYDSAYEKHPDIINVVIIVFEIPLIHTPEFIESSLPVFCQACKHLPQAAQVGLARVWSTFDESRLRDLLQVLQQLITVRVIKNEERWRQTYHVNDDDGIIGATKIMKIVYYASLFAADKDVPKAILEESDSVDPDDVFGLLQGAVGEDQRKEPFQEKEDPLGKELGVSPVDIRSPVIPFEEFVNEPLNESIDITNDYAYYRNEKEAKFSFVNHNFILTTASKHTSMYYDNRIRMLNERRTSLLQTIVHGFPPMPYLKVKVRRDHVVEDALVALEMVAMENPSDLKKQLFVEFEGEQGLDEGGVSKEFFQLIVEELFNPDIGMFTLHSKTGQYWFNPLSFENDAQFTLIGIVLGLAIYNSCILDIHFPMVVYRKLMGKRGVFSDLQHVDPTLASSLQQLLDYCEDDVEEVFSHFFQIGYSDVFGISQTHELKKNGKDIPVTQGNKREFVELYADFVLNKAIERQFRAFRRGFLMVTSESPLKHLFRPDEVEILVCGSKILDFRALEEATEYDGGFTSASTTIRNFWDVVHSFPEEEKRKLLQFTTGTDRVPVGGLSKLKLIIARNGPDSDRLPTSHTCFNVLLLPDYASKEKLQERLLKAITYAKGFGML